MLVGIIGIVALAGLAGVSVYRSRVQALARSQQRTAADLLAAQARVPAADAAVATARAEADEARRHAEETEEHARIATRTLAELDTLQRRRDALLREQSDLHTTMLAEQTDLARMQGTLRGMRDGWPAVANTVNMTSERVLGALIHEDGSAEPSNRLGGRPTMQDVADAMHNMYGSSEAGGTIFRFVTVFDGADLPASRDSLWNHYQAVRASHEAHATRDTAIDGELAAVGTRIAELNTTLNTTGMAAGATVQGGMVETMGRSSKAIDVRGLMRNVHL